MEHEARATVRAVDCPACGRIVGEIPRARAPVMHTNSLLECPHCGATWTLKDDGATIEGVYLRPLGGACRLHVGSCGRTHAG